ncbi:MAG: hypothetical protein HQL35_12565 [Alphaproteobacteria bacterium]|nr:hypothetical protein [Alphaproteobacteria bacterium]
MARSLATRENSPEAEFGGPPTTGGTGRNRGKPPLCGSRYGLKNFSVRISAVGENSPAELFATTLMRWSLRRAGQPPRQHTAAVPIDHGGQVPGEVKRDFTAKLLTVFLDRQQVLKPLARASKEKVRALIWWFYADLKAYRAVTPRRAPRPIRFSICWIA